MRPAQEKTVATGGKWQGDEFVKQTVALAQVRGCDSKTNRALKGRMKLKPRRIILYVILPTLIIYLSMRFYAQYRHVDLYVSRIAPMPAELAAGLHMEEHKIEPMVTIESPYESAEEKKLQMEEIHHIRSEIAWSKKMSPLIDSLTIQSPARVLARRTSKRVVTEYQLVKENGHWAIESTKRQEIKSYSTEKK